MIAKTLHFRVADCRLSFKASLREPIQTKIHIVIGFPHDSFSNGDQQQYAKTNAFLVWLKSFITTNTTETMEIN